MGPVSGRVDSVVRRLPETNACECTRKEEDRKGETQERAYRRGLGGQWLVEEQNQKLLVPQFMASMCV